MNDWLQQQPQCPVECLGHTFPSDQARRVDDPIIQANRELLKPSQRTLIAGFLDSRTLPDPVAPEFVAAVQEALSGLEKIVVFGDEIKQALLTGGSPATPEELRRRFETFLVERCRGKDAGKLRFVVE